MKILRFLSFYKRAQCNPSAFPKSAGFPCEGGGRGLFALLHLHNHTPTHSFSNARQPSKHRDTETAESEASEADVAASAARRRSVPAPVSSHAALFGLSLCPAGLRGPICGLNADVRSQRAANQEATVPSQLGSARRRMSGCEDAKGSSWSSIRQKASGGSGPVIASALKYVSIISGRATNHPSDWPTLIMFL